MGIGVAVFLIAVGAILTFAVHATASGFNIHTVGIILMIAGALGLVVTLTIFAPRRRATVVHERTVGGAPVGYPGAVTQERVTESHDTY
jgi:hypothetical protein